MLAIIAAFGIIVASVFLGFLPKGILRTSLVTCCWLTPLRIALWLTITEPANIDFEFGSWAAMLIVAPILLTLWAGITIFPYKLAVRLRQIYCEA